MLLYGFLWAAFNPLLRLEKRLREGYDQRTLKNSEKFPSDLWIQAASVGEVYLAIEIAKNLNSVKTVKLLITTNTRQGYEILEQYINENNSQDRYLQIAYFPFDRPRLMNRAINMRLRREMHDRVDTLFAHQFAQ